MAKRVRLQALPPCRSTGQAPVVLPQTLARRGCACAPNASGRRAAHKSCAAGREWDQGRVLLTDGTTLPKSLWLQAQAPAEEEVTHGRT